MGEKVKEKMEGYKEEKVEEEEKGGMVKECEVKGCDF